MGGRRHIVAKDPRPRQDIPVVAAPIRVLVVDDHAAVRAAVVELLSTTDGIVVVGEAVDGQDALEVAAELRPDVVLMDVSMPNMAGLEATYALTRRWVGTRVLMLSTDVTCTVVRAARDAGAVGFLVKQIRGNGLVPAIRAAYTGQPTWPACA